MNKGLFFILIFTLLIKYSYAMENTFNVMKGMKILVQAKVPISRPDDFFAEMLKTDDHMAKVAWGAVAILHYEMTGQTDYGHLVPYSKLK